MGGRTMERGVLKYLKPLLALLLLLCLVRMPYGFYELVRFASMTGFSVIAYRYYKEMKEELAITFAALALLFQPFIKIALGRTMWYVVDIAVAILLIILWTKDNRHKNS